MTLSSNKTGMKFFRSLLILLITTFSFSGLYSQDSIVDGIVAIVGNNIILKSDIEGQYLQLRAQGSVAGTATHVKCQILDELLFSKLVLHEAEVDSVVVTDAQVDAEMEKRMRYYIAQAGSVEELEKYYQKSLVQIKEELRDVLKEQMLVEQERMNITKGVTITPAEVKAFYRKIPKDSMPEIASQVEVGMIVKTPVIGPAERQAAIERLKGLRERVLKGDDFATLAVLYSEDPGSAKKGGELGMFQRGSMRPEFEAAAFKLKPGEVSEVVETEDGYHIIQLIERRGDFINVRHILIIPQVSVYDLNKSKLFLDSVANLVTSKKMTFDVAVIKFSDDPSKNNGGMMINPQTGNTHFELNDLDPKVFFVIDKLKEGDLSAAVKWEDRGKIYFRVYYLKSRTKPHKALLDDDYATIQKWALNKKEYTVTEQWVQDKIKSTFIFITPAYQACEYKRDWLKKNQKQIE
jgi:peptidyl-prolyl cis-trans isomerase SurA